MPPPQGPADEWEARFDRLEKMVRRLCRDVRTLKDRPLVLPAFLPPPQAESRKPAANWHSDTFRRVRWKGKPYKFSVKQAAIVEVLWRAWQSGMPEVAASELLAAAESDGRKVADLFRNGTGFIHPAWERMIVSHRRGFYQLSASAVDAA